MTQCNNCQGENAITGFVELWDGACPDCGRVVSLQPRRAFLQDPSAACGLDPRKEFLTIVDDRIESRESLR